MQYSIVGNDIALIMHYRALRKRSDWNDNINVYMYMCVYY